ncbi:class I SAM-dependent methyltransferase [Mucilaginibacter sp. X5P1]|uniref:class I SAM-dependent methyltransferase n=1 Tax=Mucilaginibacter sp. X5P1 TaxID=2723088 RepID=UPI001619B9F9|nr:class I SAM-dependent methyltransferase [Mucilaginibacter sp. X5P1]MBB6141371.1 SAM-dependent methyltransferase [Mucilaginibacter sp. X5P1]
MQNNLQLLYGNIDIYLFDQLLKGRFNDCHEVIDIGCGGGRNLHYFLQNGFEVYGIDPDARAIEHVKQLSALLAPNNPELNFVVAAAEQLPYVDDSFDLAICSAILHFARDHAHFDTMLRSVWRVLKPGGYLFARLASDIGIEDLVTLIGDGVYLLPDGSTRYLVNQEMLLRYTAELGAELFEPIKTTNVQNLRCMTTWCLKKR